MSGFLGMRGTGDWADNQVPENWAQYILYEFPNGVAPLFAMHSMFGDETVDSYKYHWWAKTMPGRAGSVTGIYIDSGLSTAYDYSSHQSSHGVAGGTVYVKIAEALAKEFRPDQVVSLRDQDREDVALAGVVVDVAYNGDSSYDAVELLEDDDNSSDSSNYNLSTVDRVVISSNGAPEGSIPPEAIAYDPDEYWSYVQNYRNTLDLTYTALATKLRTGEAYKEAKRECSHLHARDIEYSAFWGVRRQRIGDNGKPQRFTMGLLDFMRTHNSDNIVNYRLDSEYAGKTWLQGGKQWLNDKLTDLSTWMSEGEVLMLLGNKAWAGIEELAETYGDIKLTPGVVSYGIRVATWVSGALTVHFKTHPLFSSEVTTQNMMVGLLPKNCKFCPLVNNGYNFRTKFEKDMQIPGQHSKVDGFSTKGGWKFYHPNQFMIFFGVGKDNEVSS